MNKIIILFISGVILFSGLALGAEDSKYALHRAAFEGNFEKVIRLLRDKPNTELRDSSGGTALHSAVFQNNTLILEEIIKAGFDVNAVKPMDGNTPLHDAVRLNNLAAVKVLMDNRADPTIKNNNRRTPPDIARWESLSEIADYFKSKGF